jgi:isochorismatase transposase
MIKLNKFFKISLGGNFMCGHGQGKGHVEKMKERYYLNRNNTVLLGIDVQEKLIKAMFNAETFMKNSKALLQLTNIYDIPVIFTEQNPRALGKTSEELLKSAANPAVYEKMDFSGFCPELDEALKKHNRTNIIVIGMESHVCVYQTVRDLVVNGYNVTIVSDAVASRFRFNYDNALDMMSKIHAVISNTETVLFDIVHTSSDEHFKEAQKLIK